MCIRNLEKIVMHGYTPEPFKNEKQRREKGKAKEKDENVWKSHRGNFRCHGGEEKEQKKRKEEKILTVIP
jgi:hypothetical protein